MSIQTKTYTSRKTGKATTKYYAAVWNPKNDKLETGPLRLTDKEAKLDETDLIRAVEANKIEKRRATIQVSSVYSKWHEATKPPVYSNNTWRVYGEFYDRYIADVFGDKYINKVNSQHISKFVVLMSEKYSPDTVNKCINVLTGIFNHAIAINALTTSPMLGIKRIKVPVSIKPVWGDEMIEYFLSLPRVRASNYYAMFCISMLMGPRPEEVCGLKESYLIDIPCKSLMFDRSYDRYGVEGTMKNDHSHRIVPLTNDLYRVIKERLEWKRGINSDDPSWGDNNFMFVSPKGSPIKPTQYSKGFKRVLNAHNAVMEQALAKNGKLPDGAQILPDISLYGCRHSFATNTMRETKNAKLISSIMGNSVKTLLTSYVQADLDDQKNLIEAYSGKKLEKIC